MSNLYRLTGDLMHLQAMMEDEDEIGQEAIQTTIESLSGDLQEAVDWSVKLIRNLEADALGVESELERLGKRKKQTEGRIKSVREAIKACMRAANQSKVKTPLFSVTVASGRETVQVVDETQIPDDYMTVKTSITPDKKAIGDLFKAGTLVPGCEYVRGEPSLRIK